MEVKELTAGRELDLAVHDAVFKHCPHPLDYAPQNDEDDYSDYVKYVCTRCGQVFSGLSYKRGDYADLPPYSTNIAAAWLLIRRMYSEGWWCRIMSPFDKESDSLWDAGFTPHGETGWNGRPDHQAHAAEAPEAICRAALDAIQAHAEPDAQ